MARLYKDGASVAFNATTGKFESVQFGENATGAKGFKTPAANLNGAYEPYNYGSAAVFAQQVDNSAMGNARDCGECHVGGGGMQYFARNEGWDGTAGPVAIDLYDNSQLVCEAGTYGPKTTYAGTPDNQQDVDCYGNKQWGPSPRIELRSANTNTDIPGGALVNDGTKVTAWNSFIDIFDEDGDGNHSEVLYNDFTKTGVVEMDCLMCHMEGYDWKASKDAKRVGRFDASRAAGAGFGTPADIGYTGNVAGDGYGTTVDYATGIANGSVFVANGTVRVNLFGKIHSVPPTDNCASCHQGKYQVDWKKRGEMSASADVHNAIGCMGCHERKEELRGINAFTGERDTRKVVGETVGTSLNIRDGKLGHDPAKGGSMPWDSLNNKNDYNEFKECADCHFGEDLGARGQAFGAPNPNGAHAAAGLTAMIVQKGGKSGIRTGVANASHIDIISCDACHINKKQEVPHQMTDHSGNTIDLTYSSGGNFVDGTGLDHEGRLATHDTYEVSREMFDGTNIQYGFNWAKDGKIHAGNFLTSLFWRDKNDKEYDVNADGRPHGMDAVLPTHVNDIINWDHSAAILADGVSTDAEVGAHISALVAGLPALNGKAVGTTLGPKIKLSWVTVPFTMSHNIGMAADAWGSGGCTDCHGGGKDGGFYTGAIDANGFASFGFNPAQTAPMTKVNGMSEKTFGHPNMKDKFGTMSIPLMNNDGPAEVTGQTKTIRDMDRSEALYQTTFQKRDGSFKSVLTGTNIQANLDGLNSPAAIFTWKGWYLNIEVDADDDDKVDSDASIWLGPSNAATGTPFAHPDADPTVAELLANFPAVFTDGSFTYGFNVAEGTDSNLVITAETGKEIRVAFNSFYGPFGLKNETVVAAPIIPTCKGVDADDSISGRAEMIAYLDALGVVQPSGATLGQECFGMGADLADVTVEPAITAATKTGGNISTYYTANAGSAVTIAPSTQSGFTYYTYFQNIADGSDTGVTVSGGSMTFPTAGTYRVVTEATNVEGKVVKDIQYVVVAGPLEGSANFAESTVAGVTTLTLSNLPAGYDSVLINWADGSAQDFYDGAEAAAGVFSTSYAAAGTYRVNVAFYNGTDVVAAWADDIVVP